MANDDAFLKADGLRFEPFFGLGGNLGGLSRDPTLDTSACAPSDVAVSKEVRRPGRDDRFNLGTGELKLLPDLAGSFGGRPRDVALETSDGGACGLGVDCFDGVGGGFFCGVAVHEAFALPGACCFFMIMVSAGRRSFTCDHATKYQVSSPWQLGPSSYLLQASLLCTKP